MRFNKVITLVFMLLFVFSANFSSMVFATNSVSIENFTDIPTNHWGINSIGWGIENKMVTGYPNNLFKPDNSLSESEFAVMLAKYASNTNKDNFISIENKHWSQAFYDELLQWELPFYGYDNDVIKDSPITRGKIAIIICAKYGFNLSEKQAIYFMYENELSIGMDASLRTYESYGASQSLTRAQAVTFMQRIDEMESKAMTFKGQTSVKGQPKDNKEILGIVGVPVDNSQVDFADFGMMPPVVVGSGITTKVGADGKVVVEMKKVEPYKAFTDDNLLYSNYFDYDKYSTFEYSGLNNSIAKYKEVELPDSSNFSTAEYMNDGGLVGIELGGGGDAGCFTDKDVFLELMNNLKFFQASSAQITKAKEIVNTWYGKSNGTGAYLIINSKSQQSSMMTYYGDGNVSIWMFDSYGIADGMGDVLNVE